MLREPVQFGLTFATCLFWDRFKKVCQGSSNSGEVRNKHTVVIDRPQPTLKFHDSIRSRQKAERLSFTGVNRLTLCGKDISQKLDFCHEKGTFSLPSQELMFLQAFKNSGDMLQMLFC